jgi:hypothetical protein
LDGALARIALRRVIADLQHRASVAAANCIAAYVRSRLAAALCGRGRSFFVPGNGEVSATLHVQSTRTKVGGERGIRARPS